MRFGSWTGSGATFDEAGHQVVTVLPISHPPPSNPLLAVEIPAAVKRRLKLDDERSWVMLAEANRFTWPGPDLRPLQPGDAQSTAYGLFEHPPQVRRRTERTGGQHCAANAIRLWRAHPALHRSRRSPRPFCPFFRPAIILFAFPIICQGWRTPSGRPVTVRLTDTPCPGRRCAPIHL